MDLQDLAAFIAVAESGSFSIAATQLHLTQPAISKRVASLETQLDRKLFDRVARRVSLTEAGRTLLPHARATLRTIEEGKRALSQMEGRVAGRLSIGTSHHIGLHRLPPALKRYTQRYPDVDLDIHFMDSEVACHEVLAGKLELAIVTLPLQPMPHLRTRLVWHDPLAVVVAADHPLLRIRKPGLADLAGHPAVLPDDSTYTHRIIRAAMRDHGFEPHVRLASNYMETLKMLVATGLGWSVLPASMVDRSLRTLRIPQLTLSRELGLAWHERRELSTAAGALMQELEREEVGAE